VVSQKVKVKSSLEFRWVSASLRNNAPAQPSQAPSSLVSTMSLMAVTVRSNNLPGCPNLSDDQYLRNSETNEDRLPTYFEL